MLEAEWDATSGRPNDKFYERFNAIVARDAEAQVRKNTLPKTDLEYQAKNSPDFKAPEGVQFQIDANDPALAQARKIALKYGLPQEAFSEFLDTFAAREIGQQTKIAQTREANLQQLGATGVQRIEAVSTWLKARAGADGAQVADFVSKYPSAPIVRAMESLIRQFSNQGGADFSQSHRETNVQETGKIPNYENMTFAQRRTAQMADRMKNDPNYARGRGR